MTASPHSLPHLPVLKEGRPDFPFPNTILFIIPPERRFSFSAFDNPSIFSAKPSLIAVE
jgi:hypothetical protein